MVSSLLLDGTSLIDVIQQQKMEFVDRLRCFAFFAMIRFLIVMVVMMNGLVDQAFVEKNIEPKMQEIKEASHEVSQDARSGGELDQDKRQGLIEMRNELKEQRTKVDQDIQKSEKLLAGSKENISLIEDQVNAMKDKMGTVEKLNVFSREEEYADAIDTFEVAQSEVEEVQERLENLEDQRNTIDHDVQKTSDILAGKNVDEGWMTSMRNKIASFRDMAKWERIVTTVRDIIPTMVKLMAAFLLKTLVMPLIFLALFIKGFKYIWGIDPRKWAKNEYAKMRKIEE